MVLTKKTIRDQKAKKVEQTPFSPNRLFMSKDQVIAEQQRESEKKKKMKEAEKKIDAEMKEAEDKAKNERAKASDKAGKEVDKEMAERPEPEPKTVAEDARIKRIIYLKAQIKGEKGPGSKARKEKMQAEIDMLEKIGKEDK